MEAKCQSVSVMNDFFDEMSVREKQLFLVLKYCFQMNRLGLHMHTQVCILLGLCTDFHSLWNTNIYIHI